MSLLNLMRLRAVSAALTCAVLVLMYAQITVSRAAESVSRAPDAAASDDLVFVGPDGALWLSDVVKGPVRLLLAQGEFLTVRWSPDGRRLAYQATDGSLSVLDVYSGRRMRVAEPVVDQFVWGPDGERLAFVRDQQLWLSGQRGGAPTQVSESSPGQGDRLEEPAWAPDGRSLMFQTSSLHGSRDLFLYDISARRNRSVQFARAAGPLEGGAVSSDGRLMVLPHWEAAQAQEGPARAPVRLCQWEQYPRTPRCFRRWTWSPSPPSNAARRSAWPCWPGKIPVRLPGRRPRLSRTASLRWYPGIVSPPVSWRSIATVDPWSQSPRAGQRSGGDRPNCSTLPERGREQRPGDRCRLSTR